MYMIHSINKSKPYLEQIVNCKQKKPRKSARFSRNIVYYYWFYLLNRGFFPKVTLPSLTHTCRHGLSRFFDCAVFVHECHDISFFVLRRCNRCAPHMCFKMISRSRSDKSVIFSAFFTAILGWIYACVPSSNFVVRQS